MPRCQIATALPCCFHCPSFSFPLPFLFVSTAVPCCLHCLPCLTNASVTLVLNRPRSLRRGEPRHSRHTAVTVVEPPHVPPTRCLTTLMARYTGVPRGRERPPSSGQDGPRLQPPGRRRCCGSRPSQCECHLGRRERLVKRPAVCHQSRKYLLLSRFLSTSSRMRVSRYWAIKHAGSDAWGTCPARRIANW